jgi:curved DNA-binding protein CbpA
MTTDYYSVLGVTAAADDDVIAAAYRVLAKKFHPDTGSTNGTASLERFREIQEAFEVLGNPELRAKYDWRRQWSSQASSERIQETGIPSEDAPKEKGEPPAASESGGGRAYSIISMVALGTAFAALTLSAYLFIRQSSEKEIVAHSNTIPSDDQSVGGENAQPEPNVIDKRSLSGVTSLEPNSDGSGPTVRGLSAEKQIGASGDLLSKKSLESRIVGDQEVGSGPKTIGLDSTQFPQPQRQNKSNFNLFLPPPPPMPINPK